MGATLILAAGATRVVVVPMLMRLPADFESHGVYTGSVTTPNPAGATTVDVEIDRSVRVVQVDGNTAVVRSNSQMFAIPRGPALSTEQHTFALDRTTLRQAEAPRGAEVEDQHGAITFSLPPHPAHEGYTYYDAATRTAQPLVFAEETTFHGRKVLHYIADGTAPLADPAKVRTAIAQRFGGDGSSIPASAVATLGMAVPNQQPLPERIPLEFRSHLQLDVLADKQFGTPVRLQQTTTLTAVPIGLPAGAPITLSISKLASSDDSSADAVDKLNSVETKLRLVSWWLPGGAALAGIALISFALFRIRTGRISPAGADRPAERGLSE
ncbi:porin PorA family protein [Nocardia beijingensis]|uniref:porin PorA family protein n=1 Tax=Nocardia beijingensis TaxID=95162 RepID=UPI00332EDC72